MQTWAGACTMAKLSPIIQRLMEYHTGKLIGTTFRPDHGDASRVEKPGTITKNVCFVCKQTFETKLDATALLVLEDVKTLVNHVLDHMYKEPANLLGG